MNCCTEGQSVGRACEGAETALGRLRVHLIGIGGSGMSGAARMLLKMGAKVTGSDVQPFDGLGRIVAEGARVAIGHDASHLDASTDLVVVSAAIPPHNAELQEARRRGVAVIKYAELLGQLMAHRVGVGIAGTHGKTTTTAMCSYLLSYGGLDPSFVFGARSDQLGGSSGVGHGPHFVVESCEFDHSFLQLRPRLAAILNIEPDHLDCYGSMEALVEAFGQFARRVSAEGVLVCDADDPAALEAAACAVCRVETCRVQAEPRHLGRRMAESERRGRTVEFSRSAGGNGESGADVDSCAGGNGHRARGWVERSEAYLPADWQAVNLVERQGQFAFDVLHEGRKHFATQLKVAGLHNVYNALAASALAHHAGVSPAVLAEGLARFEGVSRRMTLRALRRGVTIIDDYAHHPTEIRATLDAVSRRYTPKRTWVVFQPHQYARTRYLLEDFARSLAGVDEILVPDVYGAREEVGDVPVVGSKELVSRICGLGGRAQYLPTLAEVAEHVAGRVVEGDVVVIMGAGDVWKVADDLVERIR